MLEAEAAGLPWDDRSRSEVDCRPWEEEVEREAAARLSHSLSRSRPSEGEECLLLLRDDEEDREEQGEDEEGCARGSCGRLWAMSLGNLDRSWEKCLDDMPPVEKHCISITRMYSTSTGFFYLFIATVSIEFYRKCAS